MSESAIPVKPAHSSPRLESIDLLRGIVMVLMALDHVRDYFSSEALLFEPTDLAHTHGALFLTRWITHFCAPVFCFLAGTGAFLSKSRGKTTNDLASFLVTRGLWLVLLELTVVRFAWMFNLNYEGTGLIVIWALGWSMVILAVLVYLPTRIVAAIAIAIVAGHNLLDPIRADRLGAFGWLWKMLHEPGAIAVTPHNLFFTGYPILPWAGVMAAGYAFGAVLQSDRAERRRVVLWLGAACCVMFVAVRAVNLYGDPQHWSVQPRPLYTLFSFVNCTKYPPSLLYVLMTLGPALIFLAIFDRPLSRIAKPLVIFGRVPLFYYLLHIPLIHLIAVVVSLAKYGSATWLFTGPPFGPDGGTIYPIGYGYGLVVIYAIWLAVVIALYPLCTWFAQVKQRRREVWLSYL